MTEPVKIEIQTDNLTFNEYQSFTDLVAKYPGHAQLVTAVLGMLGESGEVAEKLLPLIEQRIRETQDPGLKLVYEKLVGILPALKEIERIKKDIREKRLIIETLPTPTEEQLKGLLSESADVNWYIARFARGLGLKLSDVIHSNMEKLKGRLLRGTLHGAGDNR